jgi:tetratricopeptide (TPR) repeat protein
MDEIEKIKDDLRSVRMEVDAIQISVLKSHTPWYKSLPTIISILALVFSFGTTYVSHKRTKLQDTLSSKSDLCNTLQRLSNIGSKLVEINIEYAENPQAIANIGGQLNVENALLANQAAEIVSKLSLDNVSAIELYTIAMTFQAVYQNEKAKEFYQFSFREADNANDMSTALAAKRGIANIHFIIGQPENGRVYFQEALSIFKNNKSYKGYNDFTQKSSHIATLLNWAGAEAANGFIEDANNKLDEAVNIVNSLPPSMFKGQLEGQINQTRLQIVNPTLFSGGTAGNRSP